MGRGLCLDPRAPGGPQFASCWEDRGAQASWEGGNGPCGDSFHALKTLPPFVSPGLCQVPGLRATTRPDLRIARCPAESVCAGVCTWMIHMDACVLCGGQAFTLGESSQRLPSHQEGGGEKGREVSGLQASDAKAVTVHPPAGTIVRASGNSHHRAQDGVCLKFP